MWSDPSSAADPRGRHLVVLLHGAGGVPEDMAPFLAALPAGAVGVALAGRLPVRDRWAWADTRRADPTGFEESAAGVARWLDARPGWSSAGLVGFSQGGAVAVQLLRAAPDRYRYAVTLSAFLATARDPRDPGVARVRPPVLCCHGDRDDVVPDTWAARLASWARGHAAATTRRYRGLGHTMDDRETADVARFVAEHARA